MKKTTSAKEHTSRLERRASFLDKRIKYCSEHNALSYDRAELSSLRWAIAVISQLQELPKDH
jgi:hypothetical protein